MVSLEEHEVRTECLPVHCHIHNRDEPTEGKEFYRVCLECGHCFYTSEELVEAWRKECIEGVTITASNPEEAAVKVRERQEEIRKEEIDAEKIYHCPHCSHDF